MCIVHHGKDALSPLSLLNDALQRKDDLHHSHRFKLYFDLEI